MIDRVATKVITRHGLHMNEIAHIARDKNMVRRRSADLLEDCLRRWVLRLAARNRVATASNSQEYLRFHNFFTMIRRHTRSLPEVDTLQMVGLVTANQIVSKRRWRRMVLRERAVDTFAVACGGELVQNGLCGQMWIIHDVTRIANFQEPAA